MLGLGRGDGNHFLRYKKVSRARYIEGRELAGDYSSVTAKNSFATFLLIPQPPSKSSQFSIGLDSKHSVSCSLEYLNIQKVLDIFTRVLPGSLL